jgi:hypothetical protein
MKLYHFCAGHMLDGIRREGLTRGVMPVVKGNEVRPVNGYQWLTVNPSWEQSWEMYSTLKYRRNDFRITVKIPKENKLLVKWTELCKFPFMQETASGLNIYGDPGNWFVYCGNIKPACFREIIMNPVLLKQIEEAKSL